MAQNTELYFDIANSNQAQGPITPTYVGHSATFVTASSLAPGGSLAQSPFCCTDGPGKFWFGQWSPDSGAPGSGHLHFSVGVHRHFVPVDLTYTFFSGIYSGIWGGPSHLNVWASTDNFATATLLATHEVPNQLPGANVPSTFTDSLAALGPLVPGTNLEFRFVAWGEAPSNFQTPAGFVNLFPDDTNVVLRGESSPEDPRIVVQPASTTIPAWQSATLSVTASGTGLSYQWYRGLASSTSQPISGATASTYTTPPLTTGATYWVRASNADGWADSITAQITVTPPPVNTEVYFDIANSNQVQGPLLPFVVGQTANYLSASSLSAAGGLSLSPFCCTDGPGKFWFGQWSTNSSAPDSPRIEFSVTLAREFLPRDLTYTFFSGFYSGIWAGPHHLHLWASTDNFATATLVATHDLTPSLPWANVDSTFTDDLAFLGPLPVGTVLSFRFVAWGEAPSNSQTPAGFINLFSDDTNLVLRGASVIQPPIITTHPANVTVAVGGNATLSVSAMGPNLNYQWYRGNTGATTQPIDGAVAASYLTPPLVNTTTYWVRVTNSDGSDDSNAATVTVLPPSGNTVVFFDIANSNQAQGPIAPTYVGDSATFVTASSLAPGGSLAQSPFCCTDGPGKFWFGQWSTDSGAPGSGHLGFTASPQRPFVPMDLTYTFFSGIYSGLWAGPTHLNLWASTDNFATATLIATHEVPNQLPGTNVPSTFADSLSALGLLPPGSALQFRFVAWGEAPSNFQTPAGFVNLFPDDTNVVLRGESVIHPPAISDQPDDSTVPALAPATFTIAANGAVPLTYAWQISTDQGATWLPLPPDANHIGTSSPSLTLLAPSIADSNTRYRCRVINADGAIISGTAKLTVYETFDGFAARWGLSGPLADPAASPAGDGVPNLLKYALGLDPLQPATQGLPTLSPDLVFSFTVPGTVSAITLTVETSADLATWTPLLSWPAVPSSTPHDVSVALPSGPAHTFARLKVSAP